MTAATILKSIRETGWLKFAVVVGIFDALQRFFALGYGVIVLRKDAYGYWTLGERFLGGDILLSNPLETFRPPLYPIFLSLTQWLSPSNGIQMAVHLQQLIGFLSTIFLAFSVYRFTKSYRAGAIAYAIMVAATAPISFGVRIMSEGVFLPLISLFLGSYLQSLSSERKFSMWYVICGLALGFSTLTRAASHYLLPGLFVPPIVELILRRSDRTRILPQLALPLTITIVTFLTIIPWMLRGYAITGEAFLTQSTGRYLWNSSFNKKTGNLNFATDSLTTETLKMVTAYQADADVRHDFAVIRILTKSGLSPYEADKRLQQIAMNAIRIQPLAFLKSVLIRAKIYCYTTCQETLFRDESRTADPFPGQKSGFVSWRSAVFEMLTQRTRLAGPIFQLFFSIATLASLTILIFSGQKGRSFGILGMNICFFYWIATSLLTVPYCRYRMILLPICASAIAIAIEQLIHRRRPGNQHNEIQYSENSR